MDRPSWLRTAAVALVISLVASAGVCWWYEIQVRDMWDQVSENRDPERLERTESIAFAKEHAHDMIWWQAFPRMVAFGFACSLATCRLTRRRRDPIPTD